MAWLPLPGVAAGAGGHHFEVRLGFGVNASSLRFGALGFCVYGLRIRVEA